MPGGLRGWCGLWGTGCAAMREPYSKTHFYTYRPTSYLDVASGRWTPRWCDEAGHAAPLGPAWSTHQASPNGLQRRAGATSDLVRPLAQQGAFAAANLCQVISAAQEDLDMFGSLDASPRPLSHPELRKGIRWTSWAREALRPFFRAHFHGFSPLNG